MDNNDIYNDIPLYKDINDIYPLKDKEKTVNVVNNDMLKIHEYLHKELTPEEICNYIKFIDFTGMDSNEYKIISKHINKDNIKIIEPLFENENIERELIPFLSYECVTMCKDSSRAVEIWCEHNIGNITINDSYKYTKYKINKHTYINDYYIINDKCYMVGNRGCADPSHLVIDLFTSVAFDHIDIFKYILNNYKHLKLSGVEGAQLVVDCFVYNRLDYIKYLLENKAINFIDKDVYFNISNISIEMFEYLYEHIKLDLDHVTSLAISNDNFKLVKYIIKNYGDNIDESSLLLQSINGNYEIFEILINKNIVNNVEILNELLRKSVKSGDVKVTLLLIKKGADINCLDDF